MPTLQSNHKETENQTTSGRIPLPEDLDSNIWLTILSARFSYLWWGRPVQKQLFAMTPQFFFNDGPEEDSPLFPGLPLQAESIQKAFWHSTLPRTSKASHKEAHGDTKYLKKRQPIKTACQPATWTEGIRSEQQEASASSCSVQTTMSFSFLLGPIPVAPTVSVRVNDLWIKWHLPIVCEPVVCRTWLGLTELNQNQRRHGPQPIHVTQRSDRSTQLRAPGPSLSAMLYATCCAPLKIPTAAYCFFLRVQ